MSESAFWIFLLGALPLTIGYATPPRAAPWTIICAVVAIVLAVIALRWNIHDLWQLAVAAAGLSFILGNGIRLAQIQLLADRRARAQRE